MDICLDRRRVLMGVSGVAASLLVPSRSMAQTAAMSPERSLESYRRILCGAEGQEVLWWYIGDLYFHTPGKLIIPVARALTVGGYTAGPATARHFHYRFREAGVVVDLATGKPIDRNFFTHAPVEIPLVDEPVNDVEWAVQDNGSIVKTAHGRRSILDLRWTETSDNLLLLETEPGPNAFGLAPADGANDWKGIESTRTVYAKRASLARPGFVAAEMIYHVSVKLTPPWLATTTPGDHWLVVRGLGKKGRPGEIVNRDAHDLIKRFFPKYLS